MPPPVNTAGEISVKQGAAAAEPWPVRETPAAASIVEESTAWEAKRLISDVPARLLFLRAFSKVSGWITIHDKATAPETNDQPKGACVFDIDAGKSITISLPPGGEVFSVGCSVAFATSLGAAATPSITVGTDSALFYAEAEAI